MVLVEQGERLWMVYHGGSYLGKVVAQRHPDGDYIAQYKNKPLGRYNSVDNAEKAVLGMAGIAGV